MIYAFSVTAKSADGWPSLLPQSNNMTFESPSSKSPSGLHCKLHIVNCAAMHSCLIQTWVVEFPLLLLSCFFFSLWVFNPLIILSRIPSYLANHWHTRRPFCLLMESSNFVSSLQEIRQSITWQYDSRMFLSRV